METFSSDVKQKIPVQTGDLRVDLSISIDTLTGQVLLGFGDSGDIEHYVKCSGGKIYDPDNRYVASYAAKRAFSLKTVYHSSGEAYDFFWQGTPKSTNTYVGPFSYDYFHIQPENTNVTLRDFVLEGICYSITGYSGAVEVTGEVIELPIGLSESGVELEIYSASTTNVLGLTIIDFPTTISGNDIIIVSGSDEISANAQVPITLQTNCGPQELDFLVSGSGQFSPLSINVVGYNSLYEDGDSYDYKLVTYNNLAEYEYRVRLEYVDGSGEIYSLASGIGSGSGAFSSGDIGIISGEKVVYSNSMTGDVTGFTAAQNSGACFGAVGHGHIHLYATGETEYDYLVETVGMHLGDMSTGFLSGTLTGTVNDGSGFYNFDEIISGTPTVAVTHTGIISTPTGIYYGAVDHNQIAVGTRPTDIYTGDYIGECIILEATKIFEDSWTLETGYTGATGQIYGDEGWFYTGNPADHADITNPRRYDNSGFVGNSNLEESYNSVYIRIGYSNPLSEASTDVARIIIETPETGYEILVTGSKDKVYADAPTLQSGGLLTEGGEDLLTEDSLVIYA
jgi:hypothetical protein